MNRQQRRAASKQGRSGTLHAADRPTSPADVPFLSALEAHKLGRLAKADALYRRALQLDPQHMDSLHFLGQLSFQSGRIVEAVALFDRALSLAPNNPALHYNSAAVCRALGNLEEAVVRYRRALQLKPDHQGACNNLGSVLRELGCYPEAEKAFQQAIALGADPQVHLNLGSLYLDQDKPDRAAFHLRQALSLTPDSAEARTGLACAHLALNDPPAALAEISRALLSSETLEARAVFVACITATASAPVTEATAKFLQRALIERWGAARDLARFTAQVVSHRHAESVNVTTLAADTLLTALLDAAPIVDRKLEHLLTGAREELLAAVSAGDCAPDDRLLPFWCALAQQCFLNEYVFAYTPKEMCEVAALADRISAKLASEVDFPALWLVALAAYRPLVQLPGLSRVLSLSWPDPVRILLRRQVEEPRTERELQDTIPRLTPISDPVSLAVRAQYEDNPYPRWAATPLVGEAVAIDTYLSRSFPRRTMPIPGRDGGHDFLVAGCGTGQHSIEVARKFRNARVLAIDLSLASLAYAQRQSAALGVAGVSYAQADLLRLGETGRQFDVIQASGVLHHMADPMEGWRTLLAMLRPGGVMYVGLYSSVARRDVVAGRAFIEAQGFEAHTEDIRRCRQAMMNAVDGTPLRRLSHSSDFGSMSGCRDLLFHVQEHRLTLPEIATFMAAQGLTFLGFDLPAAVMRSYRARFPDDPAMVDHRHWDEFERTYPDTFSGMYQFWIQKL